MLAHDAATDAFGGAVGSDDFSGLEYLLEAVEIVVDLDRRFFAEQFGDKRAGFAAGWVVVETDVNFRSAIPRALR